MRNLRRLLVACAIVPGFVIAALAIRWDLANPFDDIHFVQELPGATERWVTFTPYHRNNLSKPLTKPIGADFAKVFFEDRDGDGIHEAVIRSQPRGFRRLEFFVPTETVLKFDSEAGQTRIEIIGSGPIARDESEFSP